MRYNKNKNYGFTLAETLMALVIGMLIMAAVVGIYSTVKNAQFSIDKRLKQDFATTEILQRISEDIDRLALPSADVTLTVKNKVDIEGFAISQMVIESKFYDKDNKPQTFEKVTWQSRVASDGNGLIVYRAHSGYSMEDKMLEEQKQNYERELFIPICSGATQFAMEVTDGNNITEEWTDAALPQAIQISLSFEPRQQDALGNMTVPEELVKTRIVALDRFRQIPYTFVYKTFGDANDLDANDVNDVNDANKVNDPNKTNKTNDANSQPNKRRK
jgi:type II secretory pathway component PulJ